MGFDNKFFKHNKNNPITNKDKIKNVTDFILLINSIKKSWKPIWPEYPSVWFRGMNDTIYPLMPSIYRDKNKWKYSAVSAEEIVGEFQRRARPFINNAFIAQNVDMKEWYQLMQHYGVPTRLLDWTEGALNGLFFALRKKPGKCPCVWVMDPWWLNKITTGQALLYYSDFNSPFAKIDKKKISNYFKKEENIPPYPAAILPSHIDVRIVSQRSVFTIHGRFKDGLERIIKKYKRNARIAKLLIDTNARNKILAELNTLGITESSLFPDLEGLSREIKYEYEYENEMK